MSAAAESSLLNRWLKFNLVGAIGILVQLAVLAFLKGLFGVNYLVATVLAVECAVLHNFVWHERFTWVDRASQGVWQGISRFISFNLTNGAVSILGNLVLMRLLVGAWHMNYVLANLAGIAACSLLNFLASDRIVFRTESFRRFSS